MLAGLAEFERLALAGAVSEVGPAALRRDGDRVGQLGHDPGSGDQSLGGARDRVEPSPVVRLRLRFFDHRFEFRFVDLHRRSLPFRFMSHRQRDTNADVSNCPAIIFACVSNSHIVVLRPWNKLSQQPKQRSC